jgi:hypothetical protein
MAEGLAVLRNAIFDHLRAVPDVAQAGIAPLHHLIGSMAQLARDGVGRDRRAAVERLQQGRAVGVPERLRPERVGGRSG